MEHFAHKLKRVIEHSGLTIEEFAHKLKVKRHVIYNINNGQKPSINFILALIQFMPNIDLNWLLKENAELDPKTIIEPNKQQHENSRQLISMVKGFLKNIEELEND